MWGKAILGAVIAVLVAVWLAALWFSFMARECFCQSGRCGEILPRGNMPRIGDEVLECVVYL
jgi:hypothetical protein